MFAFSPFAHLLFAQAVDFAIVIPIAVFIGISAVAWLIADRVWTVRHAEVRLHRLQNPETAEAEAESALAGISSAMATWLDKATPGIAKPLQPKNEAEVNKLKLRLSHAGFRGESTPTIFLGLKVLSVFAGFMLGGGLVLLTMGVTQAALIRATIVTLGAFFVPDLILWMLASRRKQNIFLGLPDAIDLMVVCVEAGLGLDQAMRKVAEEMAKAYPIIAYEFGLSNMQLQMGTPRIQVLRELGIRNGEDDLHALASVLIQASKFGSGVGQALRVQSDTMRRRRRQVAEEKAAKTAVKLIFPLVLFIFPGIFVVLVGPAAVSLIRNLFPAMSGG